MTPADNTQVGGAHYKATSYDHWNYAIDARLPYLEGQITKYVDRHARKNGKQDLEKALHFAQKLRECALEGRAYPIGVSYYRNAIVAYAAARPEQPSEELSIVKQASNWTSSAHLDDLVSAIEKRILTIYGG
jgi:Protein of unknwon function (DUF3310)